MLVIPHRLVQRQLASIATSRRTFTRNYDCTSEEYLTWTACKQQLYTT